MKAFLVFHDERPPKKHDILALVKLAVPFDGRFTEWKQVADRLTEYATVYRYPGDEREADLDELNQSLTETAAFYEFVLAALPREVRP